MENIGNPVESLLRQLGQYGKVLVSERQGEPGIYCLDVAVDVGRSLSDREFDGLQNIVVSHPATRTPEGYPIVQPKYKSDVTAMTEADARYRVVSDKDPLGLRVRGVSFLITQPYTHEFFVAYPTAPRLEHTMLMLDLERVTNPNPYF